MGKGYKKNIQSYCKGPKISFEIKDNKFIDAKLDGKKIDLYKDHKSGEIFLKRLCELTQQNERDLAFFSLEHARMALCKDESEKPRTFILNSLQQLQPKDSVEFSLIEQFLVLHDQGINRLARANHSDNISNSSLQINMAIKLLRLSQETLSTLMKYRNKGQQQVFVTHVNKGGKAIVGNVSGNGGKE